MLAAAPVAAPASDASEEPGALEQEPGREWERALVQWGAAARHSSVPAMRRSSSETQCGPVPPKTVERVRELQVAEPGAAQLREHFRASETCMKRRRQLQRRGAHP